MNKLGAQILKKNTGLNIVQFDHKTVFIIVIIHFKIN